MLAGVSRSTSLAPSRSQALSSDFFNCRPFSIQSCCSKDRRKLQAFFSCFFSQARAWPRRVREMLLVALNVRKPGEEDEPTTACREARTSVMKHDGTWRWTNGPRTMPGAVTRAPLVVDLSRRKHRALPFG